MLEAMRVECPCCGESFVTVVDCPVCCRPIEFEAEVDGEGNLITLMTQRDDA